MNFNLSDDEDDERSLLSSISNRPNLIQLQRQNNVCFECCFADAFSEISSQYFIALLPIASFSTFNRRTFLAGIEITTNKKKWHSEEKFYFSFNSTNGLFDLWMASMSKVSTFYPEILFSWVEKTVMLQVKTTLAYQFLRIKSFWEEGRKTSFFDVLQNNTTGEELDSSIEFAWPNNFRHSNVIQMKYSDKATIDNKVSTLFQTCERKVFYLSFQLSRKQKPHLK